MQAAAVGEFQRDERFLDAGGLDEVHELARDVWAGCPCQAAWFIGSSDAPFRVDKRLARVKRGISSGESLDRFAIGQPDDAADVGLINHDGLNVGRELHDRAGDFGRGLLLAGLQN